MDILDRLLENGDDGGSKPTPEQASQIKKFILDTPNLTDESFHKYLEKMGVNPHDAETIVYGCARKLGMKLKSMGVDPISLG